VLLCSKWTYSKHTICSEAFIVDYRNMYCLLARTVEYALREIEQGNPAAAGFALKLAQLKCEGIYLESTEYEEDFYDDED